jgi:hypothetical protein
VAGGVTTTEDVAAIPINLPVYSGFANFTLWAVTKGFVPNFVEYFHVSVWYSKTQIFMNFSS